MSSDLQTQLTEAEKSFKRACEQIIHLNRRLDEMAKRYDKASRENHRSFRYSLRLRMAVSEGVRNMYYEYAANKADLISELRYKVADSMGLRTMADRVGISQGVGHYNPALSHAMDEGARHGWGSTRRNGVDGTTNTDTQVKTERGESTSDTATLNAENEEEESSVPVAVATDSAMQNAEHEEGDPSLPVIEDIQVDQYDSSDMDSTEAENSALSLANDDHTARLRAYFSGVASLNNSDSEPVRTRSGSPGPDSVTSA